MTYIVMDKINHTHKHKLLSGNLETKQKRSFGHFLAPNSQTVGHGTITPKINHPLVVINLVLKFIDFYLLFFYRHQKSLSDDSEDDAMMSIYDHFF